MILYNKSLVLFDEAADFFTQDFKASKNAKLKFLVIQEKGSEDTKLFLMLKKKDSLHAQALLAYMQHFGLLEIIVRGGGVIDFDEIGHNEWLIQASSKSYGFKPADKNETGLLLKTNWPNADRMVDCPSHLSEEDRTYHKLYTLEQVRIEAMSVS